MSRIPSISLLIVTAASIVHGQSGRKVQPVPTPIPVIVEEAADYSESKLQKHRSASLSPSLRNVSSQTTAADAVNSKVDAGTSQTDPASTEEVLKVDTNLVTIPVSVFDRNGLYIPNLRQSDFKVFVGRLHSSFGHVKGFPQRKLLLQSLKKTNGKKGRFTVVDRSAAGKHHGNTLREQFIHLTLCGTAIQKDQFQVLTLTQHLSNPLAACCPVKWI